MPELLTSMGSGSERPVLNVGGPSTELKTELSQAFALGAYGGARLHPWGVCDPGSAATREKIEGGGMAARRAGSLQPSHWVHTRIARPLRRHVGDPRVDRRHLECPCRDERRRIVGRGDWVLGPAQVAVVCPAGDDDGGQQRGERHVDALRHPRVILQGGRRQQQQSHARGTCEHERGIAPCPTKR